MIEKGEWNYSAYVADLPGCVSVGVTLEEAKAGICKTPASLTGPSILYCLPSMVSMRRLSSP